MQPQRSRLFFVGAALLLVCVMWSGSEASERQRRVASSLRALAAQVAQHGAATLHTTVPRAFRLSHGDMVEVYVHTEGLTQADLQALQQHGVHVYLTEPPFRTVYAAVPLTALDTIAALPFVRWIGLPSYSLLHTGSVTSRGDVVLRAAEARTTFGIDGSGVRIGIVSDSLVDLQDSVRRVTFPVGYVFWRWARGLMKAGPWPRLSTTWLRGRHCFFIADFRRV